MREQDDKPPPPAPESPEAGEGQEESAPPPEPADPPGREGQGPAVDDETPVGAEDGSNDESGGFENAGPGGIPPHGREIEQQPEPRMSQAEQQDEVAPAIPEPVDGETRPAGPQAEDHESSDARNALSLDEQRDLTSSTGSAADAIEEAEPDELSSESTTRTAEDDAAPPPTPPVDEPGEPPASPESDPPENAAFDHGATRTAEQPDEPDDTAEATALPPDAGGADGSESKGRSATGETEVLPETLDSTFGNRAEAGNGLSGAGVSDDNVRVGNRDDSAVERGFLTNLKRAFGAEQRDHRTELAEVVGRPDFQDPHEDPRLVPERYDTPLERTDGTRTPLFNGEPTREQTKQGDLGDCGIIATLGAVASHRPEAIRDCVRETDDGNYKVRLHEAKYSASRMRYEPTGRPITLTVTPDLPVHSDEPGKPAFADSTTTGAAWAPVLEKAIAGTDQTWNDGRRRQWADRWDVQGDGGDAPQGYVRLNQGSNPSDRAELLTQLTGQPARPWEFPTGYDHKGRSPDRQLLDDFREQLVENKPILVGTRDLRTGENRLPHKLHHCHAYEVTGIDDSGRIRLRNPWNSQHPEMMTAKEFRDSMRPRYTTLD
ncbi:hypothetical protein GCM10023196_074340 [Actinoallomurus vinaceus]|uniref:Calpain catalytic domain-containing protein n=1 Tax=Actinoallomurus vinaceus TaxID=1080074 RepID=A0ABP8UK30_9ACTN